MLFIKDVMKYLPIPHQSSLSKKPEKNIIFLQIHSLCRSIEERKNALLAVKALPGIPEDIHLVLVGKRTYYTNQIDAFIKSHRLEKRVHLLHDVTFQYLPAIYQQAEIFVYPSRFELWNSHY